MLNMVVLLDGTIVDDKGNPTGQQVDLQTNEVSGTVISSSSLKPEPSLDIKGPQTPQIFPANNLNTEFELTESEKKVQQESTILQELNKRLLGQSEFRAGQEQAAGIQQQRQTFQDLSSQLKSIQAEFQSAQLQAQTIPSIMQEQAKGRGITVGGLAPLTAGELRKNQIQQATIAARALTVSAFAEAARGNLAFALDNIERAIRQKYDPILEDIAVRKANLDLILQSPQYALEDKKRALRQKEIQDNKEREVRRKEQNEERVWNLGVKAAGGGADALTLRSIQQAKTAEEALMLAAPFMAETDKEKDSQRNLALKVGEKGGDAQEILNADTLDKAIVLASNFFKEQKIELISETVGGFEILRDKKTKEIISTRALPLRAAGISEGFTAQEKRKLEQAGLTESSRQEQLNFLYGKEGVTEREDEILAYIDELENKPDFKITNVPADLRGVVAARVQKQKLTREGNTVDAVVSKLQTAASIEQQVELTDDEIRLLMFDDKEQGSTLEQVLAAIKKISIVNKDRAELIAREIFGETRSGGNVGSFPSGVKTSTPAQLGADIGFPSIFQF